MLDQVEREALSVVNATNVDAGMRMQLLLACLFVPSVTGIDVTEFDRGDNIIHRRLEAKFVAKALPILTAVVKQGIAEGYFHTGYPEEVTYVLLWGIQKYMHRYHAQFTQSEIYAQKITALSELLGRALGAPAGFLRFAP